jgi:hypothetical protein
MLKSKSFSYFYLNSILKSLKKHKMKKSFFPVILAALVLLSTSCIKNVESDGVKAVRTGQAAYLTAQATAATTLATSQAALNASIAAVNTAKAAVATAKAATENANAAGVILTNAGIAEQNRNAAAINALNEAIRVAKDANTKDSLVNALAKAKAQSAYDVAVLAQQLADKQSEVALAKVQADQDLAKAMSDFEAAKLTNASDLALAKIENDKLLVSLKEAGLTTLTTAYSASFTTYLATQDKINTANEELIGLKGDLAIAKTDIADSTTVKAQEAVIVTNQNNLTKAKAAVVDATANDVAAIALVAAKQAAFDGTPLNTLLIANQVKIDAEVQVIAGLVSDSLQKQAQINDADFVMEYAAANTAKLNAQDAKDAAALDTIAPFNAVAVANVAVAAAKLDTIAKSTAFYTTLSYEHMNNGVRFVTVPVGGKFVAPVNAKTAELEELTLVGTGWIGLPGDITDYMNATTVYNDALKALTNTRDTLTKRKLTLGTASTAFTTAKAALTPAITKLTAATAAFKVLDDKLTLLTSEQTVINGKCAASRTRLTAYVTFKGQLNGWITLDTNTITKAEALAAAKLAQDNVDPAELGTKQLLKAAVDNVDAKNVVLAASVAELDVVIASYKADLPLDQNGVVFLTAQIADKNAEITYLTSILAQQKAAVDAWLAKIAIALQ